MNAMMTTSPGMFAKQLLIATPMKNVDAAKTRLSGTLSPQERQQLALTLFDRSQLFFREQFPGFQRLVITPSPLIAELAQAHEAKVIREEQASGLNIAAHTAFLWARRSDFQHLLIVPGDIAHWSVLELQRLFLCTRNASVVITPSHDGGTNALLIDLQSIDDFYFQYGLHSAYRHQQWCELTGIEHTVLELPHLSRDVDTAEDIATLLDTEALVTHRPRFTSHLLSAPTVACE